MMIKGNGEEDDEHARDGVGRGDEDAEEEEQEVCRSVRDRERQSHYEHLFVTV